MQYKTISLSETLLNENIKSSFRDLPVDEYLNINEPYKYRYRRYSSATVDKVSVKWDQDNTFLQDVQINKYAGGIIRTFAPITQEIQKFIENNIILLVINKTLPLDNYQIGVHQIRITANNDYMGKPAPEGIHQDNFDYVAVVCVNTHNIVGGTFILVDAKDHQKKYLEKEFEPEEIIVFDDKSCAHYASPIVPKIPGDCYMDVIVVTYKRIVNEEEKVL